MKSQVTDWSSLPMVMDVDQLSKVLGVSRATAYLMLAQEGFPKVKVGKVFKVYRDGLRRWLEQGDLS